VKLFINSLEINNYRIFKNNKFIFNNNLNVIIGQNNSGKTSILEALLLVTKKEIGIGHRHENPININIKLQEGETYAFIKVTNIDYELRMEGAKAQEFIKGFMQIPSKKNWKKCVGKECFGHCSYKDLTINRGGINEPRVDNLEGYGYGYTSFQILSLLNEIRSSEDLKPKFEKYIQKIFPYIKSWKIDCTDKEYFLEINKVKFDISGDGVSNVILF
jgi:energy-coupling factor transporter ATP-binding protein EcfA2